MYDLKDYHYDLPDAQIAQIPLANRAGSRLLVMDRQDGSLEHRVFSDISRYLKPADVLVVNNTQVVPGRLLGRKATGGKVEVLILDYGTNQKQNCYDCLVKASKRPSNGAQLFFEGQLSARVLDFVDGIFKLEFKCSQEFETHLTQIGKVPLPPYIKRAPNDSDENDRKRYQTVYASQKGAVAAPTAGLHFSKPLLAALKKIGLKVVEITLHVGYGTFEPVRVDDIRDHQIHSEHYTISTSAANAVASARDAGGRVVAVGTTAVRTLEYAAKSDGLVRPGQGRCDLYIYPGFQFKAVDALITNFHLPQSTLLMLVSAFAGREAVLRAYAEAVAQKYRFFSYGDAMFIH
jgi:S-adenosylmethionine:tRNA ribosyltransferase-isomerase